MEWDRDKDKDIWVEAGSEVEECLSEVVDHLEVEVEWEVEWDQGLVYPYLRSDLLNGLERNWSGLKALILYRIVIIA